MSENVEPWEHQKMIIAPQRTINEIISEAPTTKLVQDKQFVLPISSQTPDVSSLNNLTANGGIITDFANGQDGQTVYILGDGVTVVKHNPGVIFCRSGSDTTLLANLVYIFTSYGGQWSQSA